MMELLHEQEFWFAVAFVIFVIAVWKPAGKALTGGLDARAAKVRNELDEARRLRAEAQALVDDYRSKQEKAVQSAADIVAAAKEEAERMRQEGERELKRTLAAREAQALDRISQAEQDAVAAVRARAVDLAMRAANQRIPEIVDADRANALVDQSIDELPQRLRA